jgi:guanyl-specific ribonuclease Sa
MRPMHLPHTNTDYERGYTEGYPKGHESGFQRICGGGR